MHGATSWVRLHLWATVTALLIVLTFVALLALGGVAGFVIASRQLAHTLARMSDAQLDTLADKVRELRDGAG